MSLFYYSIYLFICFYSVFVVVYHFDFKVQRYALFPNWQKEVPAHAETARAVAWGRTDFLQEHISPFLDGLGSTALDRH